MFFTSGHWRIDVLIQGYPGKSTQHGGLGWSTVALLRGHGRIVVLDGGGYGMRKPLVEALGKQGVKLSEVTDLLVSHLHHDHVVNWPMFREARIHVGRKELAWALGVGWGETAVPEHAVEALSHWPTIQLMDDGQEVLPGITAHLSPGHTPGHLLFLLEGAPQAVLLLQDAVKNRVELTTRTTDMTYDAAVSRATIDRVWEMCRTHPGCVLIPGHDVPVVVENGVPRALSSHSAAIRSWFGKDLQDTVFYSLAPPSA